MNHNSLFTITSRPEAGPRLLRAIARATVTVAACVLCFAASAASQVAPIPTIIISGETYSNVVVREKSPASVTLAHSRGMTTINASKLTTREQEELGLIEKVIPKAEPDPPPAPLHIPASTAELREAVVERVKAGTNAPPLDVAALAAQLRDELPPFDQRLLAAPAAVYIALCLCFFLICKKAGKPAPALVWLPVAQVFALFRAAKMSKGWFVALLAMLGAYAAVFGLLASHVISVPLITGLAVLAAILTVVQSIAWIVWCFKISSARGKSPLVGVLLLLPGVSLLALLYLALSSGAGDAANGGRSRPDPFAKIQLSA